MQKLTRMPGIMDRCPATIKRLRVAAYCRVSTRQEEQDSSIEQQERYYEQYISRNPNWTNAGVFSERVTVFDKGIIINHNKNRANLH